MKRFVTSTVAVLAITATAAMAAQPVATLVGSAGKVRVNAGEGFVPAVSMMELKAGDTIMVGEEGSASVSFGECTVNLDKPTVFTVTDKSACNAGVTVTPTADVVMPHNNGPLILAGVTGTAIAVCVLAKCLKDKSP